MKNPINPYGKAKKMAEDIILDFHKNSNMAVMILRYAAQTCAFPFVKFALVHLVVSFVNLLLVVDLRNDKLLFAYWRVSIST